LKEELERLALLREEDVDTCDIPEITDFSGFKRGMLARSDIQERNIDVRAIANWFIRRFTRSKKTVTNLALNKIVYLSIERALVERGMLLSSAKIEAWNYGPVFREIYHDKKSDGADPIATPINRFDLPMRSFVEADFDFTADDIDFLESIFKDYGSLRAGRLVDITHSKGSPWHVVWSNSKSVNFGMEITKELILERAPKQRNGNGRQAD
jgi:uncharacterized phage-associated protein